jgi:hypothetical protein
MSGLRTPEAVTHLAGRSVHLAESAREKIDGKNTPGVHKSSEL